MIQAINGIDPAKDRTAYVHSAAVVIGDVTLHKQASVWPCAVVRGDLAHIEIGERTNIQDGCLLHTTHLPLIIGNDVTVGHGAILHSCDIGDKTLVGMGAIVLDASKVGENCIIGAGTVIPGGKVIPPNSVVMGNPYRVVRSVTEADMKNNAEGVAHYIQQIKNYIKTGIIR
jgi:carbonic anhydrase/acetyltransferase-like protein (isoleucine patch superfamily)